MMPESTKFCQSCGANIGNNEGIVKFCPKCGFKLTSSEVSTESGGGLGKLASLAIESGRYEEAYSLSSRSLESNVNDSEMWLIKARAIAKLANLEDTRFAELEVALNQYFENCESPTTDDYYLCAITLVECANGIVLEAWSNFKNHGGSLKGVLIGSSLSGEFGIINDVKLDLLQTYITTALLMLHKASGYLDDIECENVDRLCTTAFNITKFCFETTGASITCEGFFDNGQCIRKNYDLAFGVVGDHKNHIVLGLVHDHFRAASMKCNLEDIPQSSIELFERKTKALNNIIEQRNSQASTQPSSGCFIATAVYGTPYAPEIDSLRLFRDRFLLNYSGGRLFVDVYYKHSPVFAKYIASRDGVRLLVKFFIVMPAVLVSKLWLHTRKSTCNNWAQ